MKKTRSISYSELSPAVQALNPHLREGDTLNVPHAASRMPATAFSGEKGGSTAQEGVKVRIPKKMTCTEAEFEAILKRECPSAEILFERYTFKLADDCRYTPDFAVVYHRNHAPGCCLIEFWEVKGAHLYKGASASATRSSLTKPKVAAELFPWHAFHVAKKDKLGNWTRKHYLPA